MVWLSGLRAFGVPFFRDKGVGGSAAGARGSGNTIP